MNVSSLFKSVKTIILETKEECLTGKANDVQVFDGSIYVRDLAFFFCESATEIIRQLMFVVKDHDSSQFILKTIQKKKTHIICAHN